MSRAGTIDGLKLARERSAVTGALGLDDLLRLAEFGCEAAEVQYSVRGGQSGAGHPTLTIEVGGSLRVVCQRCTDLIEYPLSVVSELELATSEAEILDATDDIDRVLASQAMDIACLVEDEIILALPIAPTHENCEVPAAQSPAVASAVPVFGSRGARGTSEGQSSTSFLRVVEN
jgi:uncharacterized protein